MSFLGGNAYAQVEAMAQANVARNEAGREVAQLQRDLAAARADAARYRAALEKIADTVTMADTLLVRGIARAALDTAQ